LSVQGDARCAPEELSRLDLPQASYGACPVAVGAPDIRGASPAAAHLAGILAKSIGTSAGEPTAGLEDFVRYRGREQRRHEAVISRN
jgi:hypothetical protein